MSECMRLYYRALPQLDMLAAYHNIPISEWSEGARRRKSAIVDQDLREQLSDTANYVNTQAAAQSQGLQRRYDYQERALTSGEEELSLNLEAVRREAERRRGVEEKLSRVQEEFRQSKLEVRQGRIKRTCDDPGEEEANSSENVRRLRVNNIHSADYNGRERNHSENRKDCNTSGERDFREQNRPTNSRATQQQSPDVGVKIIQAPRDGAAAAGGNPHGQNDLVRECSYGGTGRECYINLQEPWDVAFTEYRPVEKTEERLKYRRPLFIVRARDRHLHKSVRTFSSGKVCKRVRFLRDIRGPFCYHPFPVGTKRRDIRSSQEDLAWLRTRVPRVKSFPVVHLFFLRKKTKGMRVPDVKSL